MKNTALKDASERGVAMKDVIDVAAYVLKSTGDVSTMKLQKLVFYSQAYSLVFSNQPLFNNRIEAWANGPVAPDLFQAHKGKYVVNLDSMNFKRDAKELDEPEKSCVDSVLGTLGEKTGAELSLLTHSERPWVDARKGLSAGERSHKAISCEAIREFYSSSQCKNPLFAV